MISSDRRKHEAPVHPDGDALGARDQIRSCARGVAGQSPRPLQIVGGTAQGLAKAIPVEWLEEIVDGRKVKGVDREAFVCGRKDDGGTLLLGQLHEHLQPRAPRHLHVEEDKVGCETSD
jgi:hypothetical protein